MRVLSQRCAAVDVGKVVIAVAVGVPGGGPGGRRTVKRTVKTFYGVLAEAARWLAGLGVTRVAMEATGIYSMPVCHALLKRGDFEEVLVCSAGHVKNVPGRKTGFSGAGWLARLLERGLLAGSFMPPAQIKAARDVVCYPHEGGPAAGQRDRPARRRVPGRRDQDRPRWPAPCPPSPAGR
jgi:transposase